MGTRSEPRPALDLIARLRLKDLLFIRRIADARSLSACAAEFGLSQPAASRWLREVEQTFRAHLFERDRMVGMTPTPLGDLVLKRARALLADVASLSGELEARRAGLGAHLRIGVIPYVSERLLQRLVCALVEQYAMTVSVLEAATEPLMEELRMQRLDAVIGRCSAQALPEDLKQQVLFTQKACLLLHARAKVAMGRDPRLTDFDGFDWVLPPKDSPTWQAIIAAATAARSVAPEPRVETASTKLVHAMVSAHERAVAVLPLEIGQDLERLGGVRILPFPAPFKLPPVGLIAQSRQWNLSPVASLRSTLRALLDGGRPTA